MSNQKSKKRNNKNDEKQNIIDKLWNVMSEIEFHALYIGNKYIEIQDYDNPETEKYTLLHFPTSIIAAYLINRSCTLIIGSPGVGKTATIKFISRMLTNSSINDMDNIVHCDMEITKEDWIGTKDFKRVVAGTGDPEMIWADWIKEHAKRLIDLIVDEVNRGNTNLQNTFLSVLADGKIKYGEYHKEIKEIRAFLTMNHIDEYAGTMNVTPLQYALLDRITQSIHVPHSNRTSKDLVRECRQNEKSINYDDDKKIKNILTIEELRKACLYVSEIPIDDDAHLLALYLSQDGLLCARAPSYDKTSLENPRFATTSGGICENCSFRNDRVCRKFYGGSMRMYTDLISLGKSYAFILGYPSVTKYIINAIATDVVSHRIIINTDDNTIIHDKRKIIKEQFVSTCFKKLIEREKAEKLYKILLEGRGNENDLKTFMNLCTEDLYLRFDLLNTITVGDGIDGGLSNYKITYSCIEEDYKKIMAEVMKCKDDVEKFNTKEDLEKTSSILFKLHSRVPLNPLHNIIRQQITSLYHKSIHKIKMIK